MRKPRPETVVSTKGRVFVAQLTRDLRARERTGAALLALRVDPVAPSVPGQCEPTRDRDPHSHGSAFLPWRTSHA
jgi:hypothetical protein